jgi:hypothetical protein
MYLAFNRANNPQLVVPFQSKYSAKEAEAIKSDKEPEWRNVSHPFGSFRIALLEF